MRVEAGRLILERLRLATLKEYMKRKGHIIEEIVKQSNLEQSFDYVLRGNHRKHLREGKWLLRHRERYLAELKRKIEDGTLCVTDFHCRTIYEGAKWRNIQVFPMAERIAVNAVMTVVDRYLRKRFIRTSSSSIKGRGMHDLKEYICRDLREDPDGMRYIYKFDIRKFYETVRQDFVMYCVRRIFKDERLIAILERFVRLLPKGMSMGLRASQGLCNLLLSVYLDHYLKDRYRIKHYYRYCDDGVVASQSKLSLWQVQGIVHECVQRIGQEVKPNERVFPVNDGIDFLGYVIYPDKVRLRKRVKKQFARKLKKVRSRKRRQALVGSLWGMAKHCNSWHLLKTLLYPSEYNKIKRKALKLRMKEFAQIGVSYAPSDGKKRFANGTTQLRQLVNVRIEVLDFERDVTTKYGERWLVQFRDTRNGSLSKFFTDSDEMKNILNQLDELNEIPFATTIAAEYFGDNKVKYKFT